VLGAFLNVRINAAGYEDKGYVVKLLEKGAAIEAGTMQAEEAILQIVKDMIGV
jgi:glutamate formiminotransferase/formiminotetrahydrofolate cyclodeaminase